MKNDPAIVFPARANLQFNRTHELKYLKLNSPLALTLTQPDVTRFKHWKTIGMEHESKGDQTFIQSSYDLTNQSQIRAQAIPKTARSHRNQRKTAVIELVD